MPSINDDEFFNFNGFAAKSKDKNETAALEELQDRMGEVVSNLEHQVRTAVHRAENILGLSRAEAYRSATAAIGSSQGHELSSPDAAQPPQALEGDIIDPQVTNLEAELSRLTAEKDAAEQAWNLRDSNRVLQLDEKDRLIASKDNEITRLNNALTTALRNLATPPAPAPAPSPAPAGPTPTPPRYGQPATPAPTPPAPSATAAPAQPATPATPAPAQPATPTQPETPAAPTPQTPSQETSNQRPAGNPGPTASNPNQASTPPTRTMPAQSQRQPRPQRQQQERPGVKSRFSISNFLFGPEPEEPNNRQSR